jgi:hypothetical protein
MPAEGQQTFSCARPTTNVPWAIRASPNRVLTCAFERRRCALRATEALLCGPRSMAAAADEGSSTVAREERATQRRNANAIANGLSHPVVLPARKRRVAAARRFANLRAPVCTPLTACAAWRPGRGRAYRVARNGLRAHARHTYAGAPRCAPAHLRDISE